MKEMKARVTKALVCLLAFVAAPLAAAVMLAAVRFIWSLHDYELSGQYGAAFVLLYAPVAIVSSFLTSTSMLAVSDAKNWPPLKSVLGIVSALAILATLLSGYEAIRMAL